MPVLQIWGDLYPPLPVAVPEDQLDTNNKPQPDLLRNKLLLDMLFSKETTPSEQETKEIDDLLTKTFPDVPSHTGQYLLKRKGVKLPGFDYLSTNPKSPENVGFAKKIYDSFRASGMSSFVNENHQLGNGDMIPLDPPSKWGLDTVGIESWNSK
jgi:kynurenine formamidase